MTVKVKTEALDIAEAIASFGSREGKTVVRVIEVTRGRIALASKGRLLEIHRNEKGVVVMSVGLTRTGLLFEDTEVDQPTVLALFSQYEEEFGYEISE